MVAAIIALYAVFFLAALCLSLASRRNGTQCGGIMAALELNIALCVLLYSLTFVVLSFFKGYESLPLSDGSATLYQNLPSRQWQVRSAHVLHTLYICSMIGTVPLVMALILRLSGARDKKFHLLAKAFYVLSVCDCAMFMASLFVPGLHIFDSVPVILVSTARAELIGVRTNARVLYNMHLLFIAAGEMYVLLMLLIFSIREHIIYAVRYFFIIGVFLLGALTTTVYVFAGTAIKLDIAPLMFVLCVLSVHMFATGHRHNVSCIPLRSGMFKNLMNPILVFSTDKNLMDFNKIAMAYFNGIDYDAIGHIDIDGFFQKYIGEKFSFNPQFFSKEVELLVPAAALRKGPPAQGARPPEELVTRVFNMVFVCQRDSFGRAGGYFIVFADITESKKEYVSVKTIADVDQNSQLASYHSLQNTMRDIDLHDLYPYTAVVCTIAGLKFIESGMGRPEVDNAIRMIADVVRSEMRSSDFAAFYNDTIIILVPEDRENAERLMNRITAKLRRASRNGFFLTLYYGICSKKEETYSMEKVIFYATEQMNAQESDSVNDSLIESMHTVLGKSEFETARHFMSIKELSVRFGKWLGLHPSDIKNLELLSDYHDIGKLSTPKDVLLKRGSLTREEQEIIGIYSIKGYRLAKMTPKLAGIANLILCHTEHWDGSGRPNGLRGDEIPYLARVFAIVESYDVMTHKTPYRDAIASSKALQEMERNAGTHFDAALVGQFIAMMGK